MVDDTAGAAAGAAAEPKAEWAQWFLRRQLARDVVALVIGVAVLVTGGVLWGWAGIVLLVLGALVLLSAVGSLAVRRGTAVALRQPGRQMTAARFARDRITLSDGEQRLELRVRGQARRLPSDDDAAVRVYQHGSALVAVDAATAAVVYGRVPSG
jgi:hypothetical protein